MTPPQALIAELTHRCPMHCVYCSNPLAMRSRDVELRTEEWKHLIEEAAALGCWHLHLTGGEPLLRRDLEELVRAGRAAGLYVNLITSGLGMTEARLSGLAKAGLDHIQLSFQDSEEASANCFGGTPAHAHKLKVASWIRSQNLAFTMNAVVHRENLDRLETMIALAEELGADKLEIANVQYYGWALQNRDRLLPTRAQLDHSIRIVTAAQERLKGKLRIDFVLPDYYGKYPKPCMGGWGRGLILVDPGGSAMPCHAASTIPGITFDNVRTQTLAWIWNHSAAFERFRGHDWMQEPCRSCERKEVDFGGCRCQAFLLAHDANATDPTCSKSPLRIGVNEILLANQQRSQQSATAAKWVYRIDPPTKTIDADSRA